MRIAVVVGTRHEAIKLSPVTRLLDSEALVVHIGQHFSAGMSGVQTLHAASFTQLAGRCRLRHSIE
ncbi:MAG TPA: hypothetical protein VF444_24705 [Pseudonocardiaceae bacterium]